MLQKVEMFKYIGVVFASGRRQINEIDTRIGKANAVLRELYRSVVKKLVNVLSPFENITMILSVASFKLLTGYFFYGSSIVYTLPGKQHE